VRGVLDLVLVLDRSGGRHKLGFENRPIPSSAEVGEPIQTRFGFGRAEKGVENMDVS
jgi:hypothetical protein